MFGHIFGKIHCDCAPEKVCGICGDGVAESSQGEACDEGSYCDDRDVNTQQGTSCTADPSICQANGLGDCRPRFSA